MVLYAFATVFILCCMAFEGYLMLTPHDYYVWNLNRH